MGKIITIAVAVTIAIVLVAGHAAAVAVDERVFIIPLGAADRAIAEKIRSRLPGCFPMKVKTALEPSKDLPRKAYDTDRDQYDARIALAELSGRFIFSPGMERVLFVADVDLFVPGSEYVLGFADPERGTCIISLARLTEEFYGGRPDRRLLTDRAVKESVRELAATWGLRHCENGKCAVFYSDDRHVNDKKRETLCLDCRIKLNKRYSGSLMGPVMQNIKK